MSWKLIKNKKVSDELIRRGNLWHLFTPPQREFYENVEKSVDQFHAKYCARQLGKTTSGLLYAIMFCLQNKNVICRIVLPTLKQAREILFAKMKEFIDIIPKDVYPKVRKSDGEFLFKNDSVIKIGGFAPENIESNRGVITHLLILDEVTSFDDSVYMYGTRSVLFPQLTHTGGKIIALGTPPPNPQHSFLIYDYPRLLMKGNAKTLTIYDNPLLTPAQIEQIIELYGSKENEEFRREHLCEAIVKTELKVVPNFNTESHVYFGNRLNPLINCLGEAEKYDCIIASDLGVTDLTAIVAIFVNTFTKKAVVTHEVALHGNTLKEFADAYLQIYEQVKPYASNVTSIADCWEQSFITLRKDYNLCLQRPTKRPIEDTVALIRHFFSRNVILIHEDCKCLRKQAEFCMFDENKTVTKDIARSTIPELGHGDHLMALAYGLRRVNFNTASTNQIKLGRYK